VNRLLRPTAACLLLGLALAQLSSCTHVAPYEREHLADPALDTQDRERAYHRFAAHIYEAREGAGAVGLSDVAGGGCGCN